MRPLQQLNFSRFETVSILKRLNAATRQLAELKGKVATIPNQAILINTLAIQEAKDSSEIENIITTHDELFQEDLGPKSHLKAATKEVLHYRQALWRGFHLVQENGLLTNQTILEIQATLEQNNAGFRKVPGTTLKNEYTGETIYTPPQNQEEILRLTNDLEAFINTPDLRAVDPLIKMALIHHRFESIHPFYDGNGRTGRIINVLYLVKERLLDIPTLYLSRHILHTKQDYYRLLQSVRTEDTWEEWIEYMLTAVEHTAAHTIETVLLIKEAFQDYKHRIRSQHKFYSQDLINNLFTHPYTKIEFLQNDLKISRVTATRYLEELCTTRFLHKRKIGRTNFYINPVLAGILSTNKPQMT
ncbi:MAG: Fic family protein [Chthoniobacterales bacterium]